MLKESILTLIESSEHSYAQKLRGLAQLAESLLTDQLSLKEKAKEAMQEGIFDDLGEGVAPYRPRYILPRYDRLLKKGCNFLFLPPAETLEEAIHNLLIFYQSVPSISSYPVYIGELDTLLEPYLVEDDRENLKSLKLFLRHIDRTLPSGFTHANLSPFGGRCAKLILEAMCELKQTVPNLTLKYDPEITPDSFAQFSIKTGLTVSAPSFANHQQYLKEWGEEYGLASCYNALPVGGGSYTLLRLNLSRLAQKSSHLDDFLYEQLPQMAHIMMEVMDERVRFLVERSHFFHNNFLVQEGFIDPSRFISMFGVVGMAEAVQHFTKKAYGYSQEGQKLAITILDIIQKEVANYKAPYGRYLLHAQSGISADRNFSAGCRIPPGSEPSLLDHLLFTAPLHSYFPTGVSDIFCFDQTAINHPDAILDIVKGALQKGIRFFAFYSKESDLVRITGFLVKKSDIERRKKDGMAHHDTTSIGEESLINQNLTNRVIQKIT